MVSGLQKPGSEVSQMNVSDSIPDILQTLSSKQPPVKTNKANVIVNELSDMEADLVDLNSPDHESFTAVSKVQQRGIRETLEPATMAFIRILKKHPLTSVYTGFLHLKLIHFSTRDNLFRCLAIYRLSDLKCRYILVLYSRYTDKLSRPVIILNYPFIKYIFLPSLSI